MFRRRSYPPRPTVRAMTSMQGALSFVRLVCKQASILPPPGSTPAHNELTSPRHSLAIAAAPTSTAWHGRVRSARCELRQALMRPSPGCTPPHAALTSAAQSLTTPRCCAIALVAETNTMAAITKIFFRIVFLQFLHAGHAWLNTRQPSRILSDYLLSNYFVPVVPVSVAPVPVVSLPPPRRSSRRS